VTPVLTARTSVTLSFDGCFLTAGKVANWLIDFCHLTVEDHDTTSRLHLAAHELIENVVKYGSTEDMSLEFELVPTEPRSTVILSTRNRTTPEQLKAVVKRITELKNARDPVAYYDGLVRDTAPLSGSGLGLARIRAEAGLDVDYEVTGPDTIRIVVRTKIGK
jgi:hypothetical protein